YPWYFAWLIVFACFIRSVALLWLTTACLLLYLVPVGLHIVRDDYRLAVESMIYGPFAALAAIGLWYYRRRATRSSWRCRSPRTRQPDPTGTGISTTSRPRAARS